VVPSDDGSVYFHAHTLGSDPGDVYRARVLPGGGTNVQNVTLSSAQSFPVFSTSGTLQFRDGFHSPDGNRFYFLLEPSDESEDDEIDSESEGLEILAVDLRDGSVVTLASGLDPTIYDVVGSSDSSRALFAAHDESADAWFAYAWDADAPEAGLTPIALPDETEVVGAIAIDRTGTYGAVAAGADSSSFEVNAGRLVPGGFSPLLGAANGGATSATMRFLPSGLLVSGIGPDPSTLTLFAAPVAPPPPGIRSPVAPLPLPLPPGAATVY
jgi:hypothetical protein